MDKKLILAVLAGAIVVGVPTGVFVGSREASAQGVTTEAICREAAGPRNRNLRFDSDLGQEHNPLGLSSDQSVFHATLQGIMARELLSREERREVETGCGLYLQAIEDTLTSRHSPIALTG